MESKENVKKYYDDYVSRQRKYGITPRHRFILKRLKKFGLKSTSKVLEIGSGIGTLSILIVNEVKNGYFLGCDISEVSIKVCNAELKRSYTDFLVTDMSDFKSEIKFDFIVLPDVLEHIPDDTKAMQELFRVLKPGGKLMVLEFSKPKMPVIKQFYTLYMKFITPRLGKMFSKNAGAYKYLDESIKKFPEGKQFIDVLNNIGYSKTYCKSLSFGICSIYCGIK